MLDVHLLTTDRLPEGWQDQALRSIREAAARSPIPIQLHLLPENQEDFWKARWDGYLLGSAPWATYLDADDWVVPEVFEIIAPFLGGKHDVVTSRGWDYHVDYKRNYETDRGIRFFRRSLIEAADKESTHKCCPSCSMFYDTDNKITLEDRLVHFRVGYDSLAKQWSRKNGLG